MLKRSFMGNKKEVAVVAVELVSEFNSTFVTVV